MRVGEASGQFSEFPQKKVKEKGGAQGPKSRSGVTKKEDAEFGATFYDAAEKKMRQSLDELLKDVQSQGERLARAQNFEELEKYKDLVRAFLGRLSKELYRLKPSAGGAKAGQKVYVVIEKVDLELEKLAAMVLSGQEPQIRILEKIGQIKGLLLDAYQ